MDIKVSVICNAYNHEKFIGKCLDGFVIQKTNFNFEVLIHDDASTDNTALIIKDYAEKYPHIIKPIFSKENLYSKNDGSLMRIQYDRVRGEYIAFCEGDDYWIDPCKLQKQVDLLDQYPNVDICSHAAFVFKAGKKIGKIAPKPTTTILSLEEIIINGGGYVSTNSLVYRSKILEQMPNFRKFLSLDYTMQIHGAIRGGMLYLNEYMSVYNYMTPGSWTINTLMNKQKNIDFYEKIIKMLEILDVDLEYKYHNCIENTILNRKYDTIYGYGPNFRDLKKHPFKRIYKEKSIIHKLKLNIKIIFNKKFTSRY